MNHNGFTTGILRASIDGEIDSTKAAELGEHVESCAGCQAELKALKANAAGVREGLDRLPDMPDGCCAGGDASNRRPRTTGRAACRSHARKLEWLRCTAEHSRLSFGLRARR